MTQDEAIEIAKEVGSDWWLDDIDLHLFATLVAAAEREACAMVAKDYDHVVGGTGYYDQLGDAYATVRNIVAAIRARSDK